MFTVKLDKIPENISFSLVQNLTQPYITTRQGEYSDSQHTEKQIVYSKRTDGDLLLLKLCKSRKWLIPNQYLPLLKDGILRRLTLLLYLSKPTYRAKEKIMKKHHIKKETVFHHISHTVERKISTEIFSTNFKVFDIVMRQQDSLRRRDSPRGVSLGGLGGDVAPCSSNPGPILDQNMLFCCISRNMSSSLRLER